MGPSPAPWIAAMLLAASVGPAAADGDPSSLVSPALPATGAAGACGDEIAQRVQARYDGVDDLAARFQQRSRHAAMGAEGGDEPPIEGEVVFAKPGRMRWEYQKPDASLVLSDGHTLWLVDPGAREVQVLEVGEAFLSGTAMQFLLGDGDLRTAFDVVVDPEACELELVRVGLLPKQDATYERLELLVARESGDVRATAILDLFGNRTDVAFEDVKTNQSPPPELFRFEAPEGWRVLELER